MKKKKEKRLTQEDILRNIKSVGDLIPHFLTIESICKANGKDPLIYQHMFANKWMEFKENDKREAKVEKGKGKRKK